MKQKMFVRSGLTIAVTMAVAAASLGAVPADATTSQLSIEEERAVRAEMSEMGVAADAMDALISEVASGGQIESQRAAAVPTETTTQRTANGVREVMRFSDGSVRTVEQLSVASIGPDGRTGLRCAPDPRVQPDPLHLDLLPRRHEVRRECLVQLGCVALGGGLWSAGLGVCHRHRSGRQHSSEREQLGEVRGAAESDLRRAGVPGEVPVPSLTPGRPGSSDLLRQVPPSTRLGLVLVLITFAGVVLAGEVRVVAAVLDGLLGLPWLMLMVVAVTLARAISPGTGWARARLPLPLTCLLFAAGIVVSAIGVLLATPVGPLPALSAVVVDVLAAATAAVIPAAEPDRLPSDRGSGTARR